MVSLLKLTELSLPMDLTQIKVIQSKFFEAKIKFGNVPIYRVLKNISTLLCLVNYSK